MMKKIFFILMMALMMISVASAADKPYLTVTLMKYEPQPAEPGKYVTVFVKLENTGLANAENLVLQVVPEFPFSLNPGKNSQDYVGILGPGQVHITEFELKVDDKAVQGTNKLKVRYNINSQQNVWTEQELELSIQTKDAILSIGKIEQTPEEISPGEKGIVKMTITNLADSALSDVKVNLDLSSTTLPFAPTSSASEKNIYLLKSRETQELEFNLIAYPNAAGGVYKLPLTITYNDNVGTNYTKTDVIGIIVNSKPDVKVVVDSTTLLQEQSTGNIVLKIINKGLSNVKLMNLQLEESPDYEILSPTKEEYIGNLDSDDFETAEFQILLKNKDTIEIPLQLEYRDYNNKLYQDEMKVMLKIHSAEQLGQGNGSSAWVWIIVIVVIAAGVVIYRKRKKKAKKQT